MTKATQLVRSNDSETLRFRGLQNATVCVPQCYSEYEQRALSEPSLIIDQFHSHLALPTPVQSLLLYYLHRLTPHCCTQLIPQSLQSLHTISVVDTVLVVIAFLVDGNVSMRQQRALPWQR